MGRQSSLLCVHHVFTAHTDTYKLQNLHYVTQISISIHDPVCHNKTAMNTERYVPYSFQHLIAIPSFSNRAHRSGN